MENIGEFKIIKKCIKTKARVSTYQLRDRLVNLPIFMPVATKAAMKGIKNEDIGHQIVLANTYHLRNFGKDVKKFMGLDAMLTDSGGFQIGSLVNSEVKEEGVYFDDGLMTPEDSIKIQNTLGADIIMQLDHVVNPLFDYAFVKEAMERSLRWLDRCISAHKRKDQILFPIIQGGLHNDLRNHSLQEILKRKPIGIAIGGLSGGEDKKEFAKTVFDTMNQLPPNMPRYLMGVGYPEDVLISIALGSDMSDCVYPPRTARFGRALTDFGDINLFRNDNKFNLNKIEDNCNCRACKHSRAFLYSIKKTTNFCMLVTEHNLRYMENLTDRIKKAIMEDKFEEFIINYIKKRYQVVPEWITYALSLVDIEIK
ncbi:Queuine tRNA-ribosyltransferase [Spraguea lophii 42_110]|uniref:Queuine tRNA-ribosyltransferase n=1 Tax=Spraguea lophii (strain 42_110) TaxID=1358809 RepID=S7XF79_SPRLO|nr:Queuine tRNA-ribosyltransferase [Spraguea lophii 42_110]